MNPMKLTALLACEPQKLLAYFFTIEQTENANKLLN